LKANSGFSLNDLTAYEKINPEDNIIAKQKVITMKLLLLDFSKYFKT